MLDSKAYASEELVAFSDLVWPVENRYFEMEADEAKAPLSSGGAEGADAAMDANADAADAEGGGGAKNEEKEGETSFEGDKLFYFKALQIERIVVHITVRTNPNTDLDSVISADNLAMRPVKIMAGWLLKTLGNIDDALLQFSEFSVTNLRDKQSVVQAVVQDFYVGIAKYQVLVLLGGAFPLGNPISMFNDLGKGAITVRCTLGLLSASCWILAGLFCFAVKSKTLL